MLAGKRCKAGRGWCQLRGRCGARGSHAQRRGFRLLRRQEAARCYTGGVERLGAGAGRYLTPQPPPPQRRTPRTAVHGQQSLPWSAETTGAQQTPAVKNTARAARTDMPKGQDHWSPVPKEAQGNVPPIRAKQPTGTQGQRFISESSPALLPPRPPGLAACAQSHPKRLPHCRTQARW